MPFEFDFGNLMMAKWDDTASDAASHEAISIGTLGLILYKHSPMIDSQGNKLLPAP
jgi:hypothetical protein